MEKKRRICLGARVGFEFLCAEYQHALNVLNVFKAAEDCSFTVLDHTKQDCCYPLIILTYKIKSKLAQLNHVGGKKLRVQRM